MTEKEKKVEEQKEYSRNYYWKNKESVLLKARARYRKNAQAISKKWRDEHPLEDVPVYNKTFDSILISQGLVESLKNAPKFRDYIRKMLKEIEDENDFMK